MPVMTTRDGKKKTTKGKCFIVKCGSAPLLLWDYPIYASFLMPCVCPEVCGCTLRSDRQ